MNWFYNLKTLKKLLLGFSAVCAIMIAVGVMGVVQLGQMNESMADLYTNQLMGVSYLKEANVKVVEIGRTVRSGLLSQDDAEMTKLAGELDQQYTQLEAALASADGTIKSDEHRKMLADLRDSIPPWKVLIYRAMEETRAKEDEKALDTLTQSLPVAKKLIEDTVELCRAKEGRGKQAYEEASRAYAFAFATLCGVIGVGVATAIGIGFFIARIVANPLRQAVGVLQRVAAGDFTAELKVDTKDEIGELAGALNEAVARIREALMDVRSVAESLASSSQQLASASEEISSGAQEQASSLEQTASSLEEITSTIRQNAENAGQANQLSSGSREVAERGGSVVGNAVAGMKEINAASKKIADIITTIDEIAFQTNLLALNAAVEAARAGEQGRGFAVVAGEVRNLAQRSAGAAKEIKGLIQDSVRKIEAGSELVNQSGQALDEIIGSVKRVTDIVAQISSASREQATGIEQVNKAVSQMDQVTQSNASQTEELSSTAEGLAGQAENLQELVRRFTLEKESTRTSTATKAARVPTRVAGKPAPVATKPAAKPKAKTNGHTNGSVNGAGRFHDAWSDSEEGELVGAGAGAGTFEEF